MSEFKFHSGVLAHLRPELWQRIKHESGRRFRENEWVTVEAHTITPASQSELRAALPACAKIAPVPGFSPVPSSHPPTPVEQPAPPAQSAGLPDTSMREHEEHERKVLQSRVEARNKAKAIEDSGYQQLAMYIKAGLAETDRNQRVITEYIEKHAHGIFCAASVRAAVENERVNLNWAKVEPKPVVTAPAPSEVLGTLSDGSRQLSLSAPVPRNATVAQAKDYLARIRHQQQPDVVVVDGFKSAM
jgi:hypothetical protein